MICPYCGNSSGRTDQRGMCISCGGALEKHQDGGISWHWESAEYSGHSASLYFASPYPEHIKITTEPCIRVLDENSYCSSLL